LNKKTIKPWKRVEHAMLNALFSYLMISIKKIGVLVSIAAIYLTPVYAETRANRFTILPTVGFLYGHAEEIVYKFPNRDLYYSELLWDLKPLFYVGLTADYCLRDPFQQKGLIVSLSLRYGLPFKTGVLENRDWLNNRTNYFTHYSGMTRIRAALFLRIFPPAIPGRLAILLP
jgi:outer membrane protease